MPKRLLAPCLACAVSFCAGQAAAQETVARGAGITGGAMLGGEAVLLAEAALSVEPAWAYVLGGVAGAALGAYAGSLVENDAEPSASVWMLAAGMGLVIPTLIWVGSARQEDAPTQVPPPAPALPASARRHEQLRPVSAPGFALTIPVLAGSW